MENNILLLKEEGKSFRLPNIRSSVPTTQDIPQIKKDTCPDSYSRATVPSGGPDLTFSRENKIAKKTTISGEQSNIAKVQL